MGQRCEEGSGIEQTRALPPTHEVNEANTSAGARALSDA